MDANFLSPNAMLIQGATMNDLESMISRLLDDKLAGIKDSTTQVDATPEYGLNKRVVAARRLQISLPTLDAWTRAGIIGARKIGTRVYYTDKDINDALKRLSR